MEDDTPVVAPQADDNAPAQDNTPEPKSMDDIIEEEAVAELKELRGEKPEAKPEAEAEDDADYVEEEEVEEEAEPEVEEDPIEEVEPIDTTKFSQVGLEALPDDYKPESWSGFAKDIVDIIRGEVNKETQTIKQNEAYYAEQAQQVDAGWQAEIDQLTKAGELPKGKEQQAEVNKVFKYMNDINQKYAKEPNKQIWSFETAYKLQNAEGISSQRKQEITERRNARARVGTSGSSSGGGNKMPQIRKGESLDDIIARELDL